MSKKIAVEEEKKPTQAIRCVRCKQFIVNDGFAGVSNRQGNKVYVHRMCLKKDEPHELFNYTGNPMVGGITSISVRYNQCKRSVKFVAGDEPHDFTMNEGGNGIGHTRMRWLDEVAGVVAGTGQTTDSPHGFDNRLPFVFVGEEFYLIHTFGSSFSFENGEWEIRKGDYVILTPSTNERRRPYLFWSIMLLEDYAEEPPDQSTYVSES